MALIKCKSCGKEISEKAKKCVHCGESLRTKNETYNNNLNGTEKNINFFLIISKIVRIALFVLSAIALLLGFISQDEEIFIIMFILTIMGVISAILFPPFLEWKAYMLKNIYELNKKEK